MKLHPQSEALIAIIAANNGPGWESMSPDEGRRAFAELQPMFGTGPEVKRVEDLTLDGNLQVRLYDDRSPAESNRSPAPIVMFFHGGGWVLGNLETHDAMCRRLATRSRCGIVSVRYDLAPENPFPGPLDQCYAATDYFATRGLDHQLDPARIAVAGDSAGGNLAACVAIRARDQLRRGDIAWTIKLQLLMYPVIEPNFETGSYRQFASGHGLTRDSMIWFWDCYLRGTPPTELATPIAAQSLSGLPPAHIITAGFDVLRDEGNSYAEALVDAGVPVTHRQYDGMLHGFVHSAGFFDVGLEATNHIGDAIAMHLQPSV